MIYLIISITKKNKTLIPNLNFLDNHIDTIIKDYFEDDAFYSNKKGNINF